MLLYVHLQTLVQKYVCIQPCTRETIFGEQYTAQQPGRMIFFMQDAVIFFASSFASVHVIRRRIFMNIKKNSQLLPYKEWRENIIKVQIDLSGQKNCFICMYLEERCRFYKQCMKQSSLCTHLLWSKLDRHCRIEFIQDIILQESVHYNFYTFYH